MQIKLYVVQFSCILNLYSEIISQFEKPISTGFTDYIVFNLLNSHFMRYRDFNIFSRNKRINKFSTKTVRHP